MPGLPAYLKNDLQPETRRNIFMTLKGIYAALLSMALCLSLAHAGDLSVHRHDG